MATRTKKVTVEESPVESVSWKEPVVENKPSKVRWVLIGIVILGVLGLWCWKTNTWPIVAVVGMRPVTRFEVDQALFKQGGKALVDNLITQRIIENELDRLNIVADQNEVDKQIAEAKSQMPAGQNFDEELAKQGLDLKTVRNLISLQIRLTKVVTEKLVITTDEINAYIKENGQYMSATTEAEIKVEAEESLKQQKQNEEISKWVESVREKAKVWRMPGI